MACVTRPSATYNRRVPAPATRSWILTGSLENFRINVERGFDVIGFKERRRRQAEEFEPGDEIFFYVTGVQAFGGLARVRSEMFEDRTPIWPQGTRITGGHKHRRRVKERYPWRVRGRARPRPGRERVRPRRGARHRARARPQVAARPLAPRLPGPAADHRRGGRGAAPRSPHRRPQTAAAARARERRGHRTRLRAPLHQGGGERAPPPADRRADQLRTPRTSSPTRRPTRHCPRQRRPTAAARRASRSASRSSRSGGCSRRSSSRGSSCATSTAAWSTSRR